MSYTAMTVIEVTCDAYRDPRHTSGNGAGWIEFTSGVSDRAQSLRFVRRQYGWHFLKKDRRAICPSCWARGRR